MSNILFERALEYAKSKEIKLKKKERLGYGSDGTVWETSRESALKALEFRKNYSDELECYQRLMSAGVEQICGLAVPLLIDYDDSLLVIEMTIVQPAYLLDFGKVYLDRPPPYWGDAQIMANMHVEKREMFGEKWSTVQRALAALRSYGIYYVDPRPANIDFGEEEPD